MHFVELPRQTRTLVSRSEQSEHVTELPRLVDRRSQTEIRHGAVPAETFGKEWGALSEVDFERTNAVPRSFEFVEIDNQSVLGLEGHRTIEGLDAVISIE